DLDLLREPRIQRLLAEASARGADAGVPVEGLVRDAAGLRIGLERREPLFEAARVLQEQGVVPVRSAVRRIRRAQLAVEGVRFLPLGRPEASQQGRERAVQRSVALRGRLGQGLADQRGALRHLTILGARLVDWDLIVGNSDAPSSIERRCYI